MNFKHFLVLFFTVMFVFSMSANVEAGLGRILKVGIKGTKKVGRDILIVEGINSIFDRITGEK